MRFENVLVTGTGGKLGSYVAAELRDRCNVSGFDMQPSRADIAHQIGDITDPAALAAACKGKDAVLHIAARPNIWSGSREDILRVNTMGVWNVLTAAEAAGVRRVVLCSSDSVVGFTVMSSLMPPDYLPIDGAHPLRPTDPYALSKLLGEEIGKSFVARKALEVIALRPVFVLYPEMEGEVRARAADPSNYRGVSAGGPNPAGGGPAWHYVDPRDAARAFRFSLECDAPGFAAYFVCGPNTMAPEPTLERLKRYLGRAIDVRRPEVYRRNPFAPLYDLDATRDGLGFEPQHDLRPLLYSAEAVR